MKKILLSIIPLLIVVSGAKIIDSNDHRVAKVNALQKDEVTFTYDKIGTPNLDETHFYDMIDGNFYTFIHFARNSESEQAGGYLNLEFKEEKLIEDIFIRFTDGTQLGDAMNGVLQYATADDYLEGKWVDAKSMDGTNPECYVKLTLPVMVKAIRLYNRGTYHWIGIGDILFNTHGANYISTFKRDSEGSSLGLHQGEYGNLNDNDDETFIWTNNTPNASDYIQLNLNKPTTIYDLKYKFDTGDHMVGSLMWSQDGVQFNLIKELTIFEELDFTDEPLLDAVAIRMQADDTNETWVKLFDFSVNNNVLEAASESNMKFIDKDSSNPDKIIDHDLETYAWYDWKAPLDSFFVVNYKTIKSINNILLLQGVNEHSDDYLRDYRFEYSLDGLEFNLVKGSQSLGDMEILFELSEPIQAKYLRVVNNTDSTDFGISIREFSLNYTKIEAPINIDSNYTYTYSGEEQVPEYKLPYTGEDLNAQVSFKDDKRPLEPGKYEMTIVTQETAAYVSTTKKIEITILDTVEHFLSSWNSAVELVEGDLCKFLDNASENELVKLIDIYHNYLSVEDNETIANTEWNGSSTIGETINYLEGLNRLHQLETDEDMISYVELSKNQISSNSISFLIISGFGIVVIGLYYVLKKCRAQN